MNIIQIDLSIHIFCSCLKREREKKKAVTTNLKRKRLTATLCNEFYFIEKERIKVYIIV
jgi:hypothetical protein